jgi:small subunit ribosomal protein S4
MPVRSPRLKIVRRLATQLPGLTRKMPSESSAQSAALRTGARRHRKPSAYRLRLEEKQKLRFNYGVTEGQMRRYLATARRQPGDVGENLLALLERRLDSVVFRLGFAPTIPGARQMVVHGHVRVDGRRLDRPGYLVEIGDLVSLSPAARERASLRPDSENVPRLRMPSHLRSDPDADFRARVVSTPSRGDVPLPVREALLIEFYAR